MLLAILAVLFVVLLLILTYYGNNVIDITEYDIDSDNAEKSFKIVHLSDLHSRPFEKIITEVEKISPDMICITGDYIDDKGRRKDKMLEYGKRLLSIAPVTYITGNHERRLEYFDELMQELREIGFTVLINEICENDYCTILGLDENQASFEAYKQRKKGSFQYKDMSNYFEMLSKHQGFKLVLSHFPENFMGIKENNYSQYDFDVQLSGHAHGGQWIFPLIGPIFSPGQGLFPKHAVGTFGERPKLIISRGIGNSEFPLRIFNHPEIVVVNVKSGSCK